VKGPPFFPAKAVKKVVEGTRYEDREEIQEDRDAAQIFLHIIDNGSTNGNAAQRSITEMFQEHQLHKRIGAAARRAKRCSTTAIGRKCVVRLVEPT